MLLQNRMALRMVIARCVGGFNEPFPLTPALSLGERVTMSAGWEPVGTLVVVTAFCLHWRFQSDAERPLSGSSSL
jgi:hypothetical protein